MTPGLPDVTLAIGLLSLGAILAVSLDGVVGRTIADYGAENRGEGGRQHLMAFVPMVLAACGLRFGTDQLLAYLYLVPFLTSLVCLSIIDLRTHRLPNKWTGVSVLGSVAAVLFVGTVSGTAASMLVCGVVFFAILAAMHLVYPPGMGLGDVKWAPTLGVAVGFVHDSVLDGIWAVGIVVWSSLVVGGLAGLAHRLVTGRRDEIPFGPALAVAVIGYLFFAPMLGFSTTL